MTDGDLVSDIKLNVSHQFLLFIEAHN